MPPVRRRDVLLASAPLLAGAGTGATRAQPADPRPNILFIVADDMGSADLSCYGRPDLNTPGIDRIATAGVRFAQAYANSPVCTASRVAIITGRYPPRLAIGLEEPLARITKPDVGLPPGHPTLPSLLRAAGYATALVGKWHLGNLPAFGPLKSGYDQFWGFRSGGIDYYTHIGTSGGPDLWDGDQPIERAGYMTELLGDRAVQVIDGFAAGNRPFLLSLHFNAPHWPWEAPGDQAEAERLRGHDLHDWDGGSQETYRRMIAAMDDQVARVLDTLERHGMARNTIVIFTSDNGGERYADTWPFTGRKTELLEGGLRVPALVSWPARIAANRVSDQVTANMDWMPTLLAAAGVSPDPAFPPDGTSLLPHLVDGAPMQERTLFWRYKSLWQRAVRSGNWKMLRILDHTFLFDVAADPMERANLRDRHRDVYDRLVAEWDRWNAGMLPETPASFTENFDGAHLPDRMATPPVSLAPDPTLPGSAPAPGQPVSPFKPPR